MDETTITGDIVKVAESTETPSTEGGVEVEQNGAEELPLELEGEEISLYGKVFDEILSSLKHDLENAPEVDEADAPGIELCNLLMGNELKQRAVVALLALVCHDVPELAGVFAQSAWLGEIHRSLQFETTLPEELKKMEES